VRLAVAATAAMLGHILHNATVAQIAGESYRLKANAGPASWRRR